MAPLKLRLLRLAALSVIICGIAACHSKSAGFEKVPAQVEPAGSEVTIKDFETYSYKGKRVRWILRADLAYLIPEKNIIKFDNIDFDFFEKPKQKISMKGEKGVFHETKRVMDIEKDVRVVSHNGRKLFTEKLTWNEKTGKLTTDKDVKILFPEGDVIQGKGLIADQHLNKITILEGQGYHPPGD